MVLLVLRDLLLVEALVVMIPGFRKVVVACLLLQLFLELEGLVL